jgi:hypothetical protein
MTALRCLSRLRTVLLESQAGAKRPSPTRSERRLLEALEDRQLLSTFTVTNLQNSGRGSLRSAIIAADARPGADTIDFGVAGAIRAGKISLPAITDTVTIDGSTAPSFAGTPVVLVNFRGTEGLQFRRGSDNSTLASLALVNAREAGVTLRASHITVEGNYIGLRTDGKTAAGNGGDGIRIDASSRGNLIGHSDPVTGVSFYQPPDMVLVNTGSTAPQPVASWQGIRGRGDSGDYLISGNSGFNGLLYMGPISGSGGTAYEVNYPSGADPTSPGATTSTSVYGPDDLGDGGLRLVGSYKDGGDVVHGFLFQGTAADLSTAANYRTIDGPGATFTYVHSTMGDLAVGNTDGAGGEFPIASGHAFLYDVNTNSFLPGLAYPGSTTTSAYGIWYNGGTGYTIVGGYSTLLDPGRALSHGFMVDYDSGTGLYTHWTSFDYPNGVAGQDYITHFEGISSEQEGVYTLVADTLQAGASHPAQGSLVTVRRNADGSFGPNTWSDLNYPDVQGIVSANSVAGDQVVGIVIGVPTGASSPTIFPYQATVNTGFRLSNVISGNRGNGIGIYGSGDNRISMNNIGTDVTGTLERGNAKNGILVTEGAARNFIGGQSTGGGNDPTKGTFVRPPQGNLISGNKADGVLINERATRTLLSGNFVGTSASGNSTLGNGRDGVAILGADGNELIGCTFQQSPFVFYNVLSGNGGEGLRVNNSDDTTVQANFMGVGADNGSIVPNKGNGLLVSGTSRNTQVGGVIPLGNVIAGNDRNGIEVKDKASGFVSFNTFAGLYAFSTKAPNKRNGILVTSTGGNNLIRTCIISGNLGNGIEIGGEATGVQVTDVGIGTDSYLAAAIPNGKSGILISGRAHGNAIGGFQPSVLTKVTVSSNRRYGIEVVDRARDNTIVRSLIGTDGLGLRRLGNTLGGIYLGSGTSSTTIGGAAAPVRNLIRFNGGNGVTLRSSRDAGIAGNNILNNGGYGLRATGNATGSTVQGNTIVANAEGDVNLDGSAGIDYTR